MCDDLCRLDPHDIHTLCDVGAGSGSLTRVAQELFPKAASTIIEKVDRLANDVRNSPTTRFVGDKMSNAMSNEQYDLVISTDVLEHVCDWSGHLKFLVASVKTKGHLYIQVPSNYPSPNYPAFRVLYNRVRCFFGNNDPAYHLRHGISIKDLYDRLSKNFKVLVAEESYITNGVSYCEFKPRVRFLGKKL